MGFVPFYLIPEASKVHEPVSCYGNSRQRRLWRRFVTSSGMDSRGTMCPRSMGFVSLDPMGSPHLPIGIIPAP